MGLLFGSAGAHTHLKSGQVAPPPPRILVKKLQFPTDFSQKIKTSFI